MKTENRGVNFKLLVYVALALSILGNVIAIAALLHAESLDAYIFGPPTSGRTYTATGPLLVPPSSLADAPVITAAAPAGSRLTGINSPFSVDELSVINQAPSTYFETAGEMFANGSLKLQLSPAALASNTLVVDGKPSVIYLGAISCIFCGENRWAMALALGRFGNFSQLFKGYSALGDGDVPTIFWRPVNYNATSSVDLGNFYRSDVINFLSIEYSSPITGNFQMQTVSYIFHQAQAIGNQPYVTALQLISDENNFGGTPYTVWGNFAVPQANAIVLGNSSTSNTLTQMTHDQVLSQLAHPKDQFAWSEYAAADLYVALTCASLKNVPQICSLPAITKLETTYMGVYGY